MPESTTPLTPEQINISRSKLDHDWQLVEGKQLVKSYALKDFVKAVELVNQILPIAEALGHHPDIAVSYGKVEVTIWTHTIGGLTVTDFDLAGQIERAFNEWQALEAADAARG